MEKPSLQSRFTLLTGKFSPPKFPFPKYKRKIWREKIYFANKRGPIKIYDKIKSFSIGGTPLFETALRLGPKIS
jgi:hypothetical protein